MVANVKQLTICLSILFLTNIVYAASIKQLTVPSNFKLHVFAENVENARQMALGDQGTIFVGSRDKGNVYALQDTDGDFLIDKKITIASNLLMPSGLAFKNGDLYVAAVSQILKYTDIEKNLTRNLKPQVVFDNLPNKRHHGWKYIDFSPAGELFVPVGAPCNVCDEDDERFSTILKVIPGTDEYSVYAHGVRNSVGFDWHPTSGELWFSDNGRDMMGDDIPPCELNRATTSNLHFGFPYVHAGSIIDPEFFNGHDFTKFQTPALSLGAHVAPLGIHFYQGKMFPKNYHHQLFVAEHGSWNRSKKSGYRVMVAKLENNQVVSYEPIITGFLDGERTLGRPVAFLELADGSLLISDDFADKIYRLTYK